VYQKFELSFIKVAGKFNKLFYTKLLGPFSQELINFGSIFISKN